MSHGAACTFETWRRTIAGIAANQHGHVPRRQLLALGIPATTIAAWVRDGRLLPVHAGVYAVAYRRPEPIARAAAAVLAGWPDAVLSHDSAAALWGLRRWPDRPEISSTRCIRRPEIRAHQPRHLPAWQTTTQWGIRTVTAHRALTEIWPRLTARQRTRLPNTARLQRLISADEAAHLLGHRRNPTRSANEDRFQQLIDADPDLPQPQTNVIVCGREADASFAEHPVVVEIDDPATHGDPHAFADNRRLDTGRAAHGILTVRLLAQDIHADPAGVTERLATILASRGRAVTQSRRD